MLKIESNAIHNSIHVDADFSEYVNGDFVAGCMNTKWNALGFRPGLVGGHCIGVDPYYFTYEAEKLGYHSQIILNGRIVNDSMGAYVADAAIKKMIEAGQAPKRSKVVILGLTFKENCPDTRNSKVDDIIKQLNKYGIKPIVVDPWASERDAMHEYGVTLTPIKDVSDADCVIVAVAHNEFRALSLTDIRYFMTIPEACQLVMTSGAMASNGELYVLDMGNPVKILDLAENMVRLSGLEPYKDIQIIETGLRPGEKLYEELLIKTEELDKTDNDMIFVERDKPLSEMEITYKLQILREAINSNSNRVVKKALMKVVPTYRSPEEVNKNAIEADEMRTAAGV